MLEAWSHSCRAEHINCLTEKGSRIDINEIYKNLKTQGDLTTHKVYIW